MPTTATEHTLLTPSEVAQRLRLSAETVRRYCREGAINAVKVGRVWRIKRGAVFTESGALREQIGPSD